MSSCEVFYRTVWETEFTADHTFTPSHNCCDEHFYSRLSSQHFTHLPWVMSWPLRTVITYVVERFKSLAGYKPHHGHQSTATCVVERLDPQWVSYSWHQVERTNRFRYLYSKSQCESKHKYYINVETEVYDLSLTPDKLAVSLETSHAPVDKSVSLWPVNTY